MIDIDPADVEKAMRADAVEFSPVTRPDTPEPKLDALGRSNEKKRGRAPLPRDEQGRAIHPDGTVAKRRTPKTAQVIPEDDKRLTDEFVGKALSGAFALVSVPLGPHWKLFTPEQRELAEAIGPLARLYGSEEMAKWISVLMIAPVVVNIVMPRLAVQHMIAAGEVEKRKSRGTILRLKAFMEAESVLDIATQVAESKEYLQSVVRESVVAVAGAKVEEIKGSGVFTNNAES